MTHGGDTISVNCGPPADKKLDPIRSRCSLSRRSGRSCWLLVSSLFETAGDEMEDGCFEGFPHSSTISFILGTAYNQSNGIILSTPEITKQSCGDDHQSSLSRDLTSKCRH